jgi:hypothetical protein
MKCLVPISSETVTVLNRMQSLFSISKMRDDRSLELLHYKVLPAHQFDSAVLGPSVFRVIRSDRRIQPAAECV